MQISSPSAAAFPSTETLPSVGRRHRQVALAMAALTLAGYFLFILVIAFCKEALSVQVVPGLSLAIVVGVAAVVFTLLLTFGYVVWVNRVHDAAVLKLSRGGR